MPDVPRRLPPTPEERLNVIASRMAGGSNAGSTRWAKPVTGTGFKVATAARPAAAADPPATGDGAEIHTGLCGGYVELDQDDVGPLTQVIVELDGLSPARLYLVEGVIVASCTFGQPDNDGRAYVNLVMENNDSTLGTSRATVTVNVGDSFTRAVSMFGGDGATMTWVTSYGTMDATEMNCTAMRFELAVAVNPYAVGTRSLQLTAHTYAGALGGVVHPSSWMRATYVGDVVLDT